MDLIHKFAMYALPVLFAITAHEAAHAYIAMLLGDKTAYRLGRVTLDPRPHIDLLGTVVIPALCLLMGGFLFGWAKPVPVNVSNLRYGRKSFVWVALAGPISNMIMAILWALIAYAGNHGLAGDFFSEPMAAMGAAGISINMALMIFNLLPIPPLDGSRLVARFLKGKALATYDSMERYGMFIVMGLSFAGLLGLWFAPWMSFFSWIPAIAA
jgi:Zn-dependent protease